MHFSAGSLQHCSALLAGKITSWYFRSYIFCQLAGTLYDVLVILGAGISVGKLKYSTSPTMRYVILHVHIPTKYEPNAFPRLRI